MKRLPFRSFLLTTTAVGALGVLAACGGISDPTVGGSSEHVSKITGALSGAAVPAGARVALVWKVGSSPSFAVGTDVAVADGKFTMDLTAPADSYFFAADGGEQSSSSPGMVGSTSGSSTTTGTDSIKPLDNVGGSIAQDLSVAVAGFVVYVDTNGNGKLDIGGTSVTSTDQVIGGESQLILSYLRNGGPLDYEKLRDKAGVAPVSGYNLRWDNGERWLPLNEVELKLASNVRLPSGVCFASGQGNISETAPSAGKSPPVSGSSGSSGVESTTDAGTDFGGSSGSSGSSTSSSSGSSGSSTSSSGSSGSSSGFGSEDAGTGPGSYPPPGDPNLKCSPDGYSFTYSPPSNCNTPPNDPTPSGLCSADVGVSTVACTSGSSGGSSILPGSTPPEGWPCPVSGNSTDTDASVSGGEVPVVDAGK